MVLVRHEIGNRVCAVTGPEHELIGTLAAGDIKLFLAIGLLTGWFSWLLPLYALVAGYILAIPHAGILLARRRRAPDADTHLPFGPYLVAAALLVTIAAKLAG